MLDFETDAAGTALAAGHIVSNEWAACGIYISTSPGNKPPMIFDSGNPSQKERDLGTPNEDFGGPGVGHGGEAGQPGENRYPLRNILTISDGDPQNPNDNGNGGTYIFTFDRPMCISSIQMIDVDDDNDGMPVRAFDGNGNQIRGTGLIGLDDNSILNLPFEVEGAYRLEIKLRDSGALTALYFCS